MHAKKNTIQPEIHRILSQFRRRIRSYVFLEGVALVVALLGLLFWVSLGVDLVSFKLTHRELPLAVRAAFDIFVLCLLAGSLFSWVLLRSLRTMRLKALALVLERRFPELDDRLVTAVEVSDSISGKETPLTQAMLSRTVAQVESSLPHLDLGAVFEKKPLRRAMLCAIVLVVSIGGFAWADQDGMRRWTDGFIGLKDVYWQRDYELNVKVVAQPGDRIREFDDSFHYKHPRGDDLSLLIEVAEGKKVPETVRLRYRFTEGRGGGDVVCTQDGERSFRYSLGGLLEDLRFDVIGGDFRNRRPYVVEVVEPPRVDQLVLESNYPAYTGMQPVDNESGEPIREANAALGLQISQPAETEFLLRANANKPLVGVRLQFSNYELTFGTPESVHATSAGESPVRDSGSEGASSLVGLLTVRSEEGLPEDSTVIPSGMVELFFSADRTSFVVPFLLSEQVSEAARQRAETLTTSHGKPFLLPPDTLVRIYLHDTDDIIGSEPARLTVNSIIDQPPIVETALQGVGIAVTRKAKIPVAGTVRDDYGLARVEFSFKLNEEEWQLRELVNPPQSTPRSLDLETSETVPAERFDVLPLDLQIGQKLTISISATDNDNLNGPHVTRGESYAFQIVSNEELLSLLYEKELNLRKRFERIIEEVEDVRKDLILHRTRVEKRLTLTEELGGEADEELRKEIREIDAAVAASAERALHTTGKDANENAAIEQSFRDIREELVNNLVDTPQLLQRIDELIVEPLHEINSEDFPAVDDKLRDFRFANEKGNDPIPEIDASVEQVSRMLDHMQSVLIEMRKLETFQEALEILKNIIGDEEALKEKTEQERKKELIKGLIP